MVGWPINGKCARTSKLPRGTAGNVEALMATDNYAALRKYIDRWQDEDSVYINVHEVRRLIAENVTLRARAERLAALLRKVMDEVERMSIPLARKIEAALASEPPA